MVDVLECTVMPYAWGSRTAIASLIGRTSPAAGPEPELWMGAHPVAPSRVQRSGRSLPLSDAIAASPEAEMGPSVAQRFGPRLPFLLKVLAADEPLSLQAHPDADKARAGFEDEERRGIPRTAPHRNYKDASHKPELLCALSRFDALSGFRRAADTLRLVDALAVPALSRHFAPLRHAPDETGMAATFRSVMTLAGPARAELVADVARACAALRGPASDERDWVSRLAAMHPDDAGVIAALMLNFVRLEPGEAIYLDAGKLHAYLGGVGVEIMASSDNVLRCGLTPKHVDVPELMRVLDFRDGPVLPIRARPSGVERIYDTPAREFRLSVLEVGGTVLELDVSGPEILLCSEGRATVTPAVGHAAELARGGSAFVPASAVRYRLEGTGTVYRATVGLI